MNKFHPDIESKQITNIRAEKRSLLREKLYRIVEYYLDNDPSLKLIADRIISQNGRCLKSLINEEFNESVAGRLEVIVNTNATRPSFLVRNGKVDYDSSPVGDWNEQIYLSHPELKKVFDCVGRINLGPAHIGTGILVKDNIILTNRHVLEEIAFVQNDETWNIYNGAHIDFGHEFNARLSFRPRELKNVIFCSNHPDLDFAIIELEDTDNENISFFQLNWSNQSSWPKSGTPIYTIGYPGKPIITPYTKDYTPDLLEQLFQSTYGYKRISPGYILQSDSLPNDWSISHDATTLGGNSGSLIVVVNEENTAAGIHFGGKVSHPRENYGHNLANVMTYLEDFYPSTYEYLLKC